MAKAEGIPPTASVASVGFGLNYIGKEHCYAYSGVVAVAPTETTMLDFTTGAGFIFGKFQFDYATLKDAAPGDDAFYKIEFNGLSICQYLDVGYSSSARADPHDPIPVIIPPFTHVVVSAEMGTSNTINQAVRLTGRVYDA